MHDSSNPITLERFRTWVHEVARRLYDSPALEKHPLAELLADPEDRSLNRAQNLRRLILDAVESTRPSPNTPVHSLDWRVYRILELRLIDGLNPEETMARICLQRSQFYSDQAQAFQALASYLWRIYQDRGASGQSSPGSASATRENLVRSEMDRVRSQANVESIELGELLTSLEPVIHALAGTSNASVSISIPARFTAVDAERVLVRQAVLEAIACRLESSRGGAFAIRTFAWATEGGIEIESQVRTDPALSGPGLKTGAPMPGPTPLASSAGAPTASSASGWATDLQARLDLLRQLLSGVGASVQVEEGSEGSLWQLVWPERTSRTLLVVDDNSSFQELIRRYLVGHVWRVVGANTVEEARRLVVDARPTVILLDVLMPKEDGWEFLLSLRSDPETNELPIVVCSVLGGPQLALSLGAAAYLPKPVSEQSLLQILAPWG